MNSGKVFLGVLAGLAAGAALGVLFAPAKGSKTRREISGKGKEYTDELKDKFDEFIENVTEKFEKVKEEVSEFAHQAKTYSEDMKKDVKSV
jgi:gas vesicle protein